MIVVRVELHSAITGKRTELARMNICNIGGSNVMADYRAETLRGRNTETLNKRQVQREAKVLGHAKQSLHVWNLVTRALNAMGYGKTGSDR